jgi:hypothetical protein
MERINKYVATDGKEFTERKHALSYEYKLKVADRLVKSDFIQSVATGIDLLMVIEEYYKLVIRKD